MKILRFIALTIVALFVINCSKSGNDINNLDNRTRDDTIGFRYINTSELLHCMLVNDIEMKKNSFLIRNETELKNNFTSNSCNSNMPEINFSESIIIGFKTAIKGSGAKNQRLFTFDSLSNIYLYTITGFENDTSLLTIDLNWITIPKIEIDSVIFKLNIIKE
jgi:hypothetical protein